MQRVHAAPRLHIQVWDLGGERIFKAPQSGVQIVQSLQRHVELATAACTGLHHLKMLVRWHLKYIDITKP